MQPVIQVKNVTKTFEFWSEAPRSLKTILVNASKGQFHFGEKKTFCALNNVSFDVYPGEFLGIMGRNGAGKSTLLKLITGIYTPTTGSIQVTQQIAPMIEVGAGFHSDLSGEENIYLNASILGFGRKATQQSFNKILEFSELGDFIKMPVRTYSSGMVVRLGFSIAVHLESPILLLDEVLAVGDMGFQRKCLEKIMQLHKAGKTIVFISHDSAAVGMHSTRTIVIDNHQKVFDGNPAEGVQLYQQLVNR